MSSFTIRAPPASDIWRKPPSTDIFNAPSTTPSHLQSTAALPSFLSAAVTFKVPYTQQYDQGGILLTFNHPSSPKNKWIKAGIEYYNGTPRLSVVSCDNWADWSVGPLTEDPSGTPWTTVSIQREGDDNGVGFWVYQILSTGEKIPVREICWVYGLDEVDQWDVKVEAMAARPAKGDLGELEVEVKDMSINWKE
ncbi:hypothetical protein QBC40DRAFT_260313 [Triangularia verruculosa]|uniref:Uncharacterized protein n=1 Tax=Triangularia verruculosa TaxID=2587418 RepID=A0AAN7AMF4_9PEZI|nr:hypothetical protein QBC40DRAFT_260313 [Triangularia verruculosa]